MHADIEGRVRIVRMMVDLSDYELAWTAQKNDREVVATGVLEHAGKIRELTEVTQIRIVSDGEPR